MTKDWRIYTLVIIIFLISSGILARLFSLQIFSYEYYSAWAQDQHQFNQKLFPERGEVFMQDLSAKKRNSQNQYYPLAINKEFFQVYLVPKDLPQEGREELAQELSILLNLEKETILQRMEKPDDPYEPLKHKVSQEIGERIREMDVPGLGLTTEIWRYYPNDETACHLIGFVGISADGRTGQYGLERYYENKLKGKDGFVAGEKDTTGYWIPSLTEELKPAEDGSDIILTLDQNIQFRAEKELRQIVEKWQAEAGTIIIMNPKTGAILAMANWPAFNPNEYNKVKDINNFLNSSVQEVYEPGSVFKAMTMAAGLDSGKVTSETVYYDEGKIRIKGSSISNVDGKAYENQTMIEVLEKSLNTGAVYVQRQVGQEVFGDYVQKFGFGQKTGIDLVGEVNGDISNLFTGREINLATISFGQGITVTPIGLLSAVGAIANDGNLMRPFVVEKIISPDGEETITQPEIIQEVITPQSAKELSRMLVSVVENGFGKPARVSGYDIAGKTGTAQIADLEEGGYTDETVHSFIGFAPAFNPEFAILIKMDKPQGIRFASDSVSPVFGRLAEYLFNYLEIPHQ
ncbi:MAG: penicillin-binding protein 2 [Candidatus Portnoybacteria bacterium]